MRIFARGSLAMPGLLGFLFVTDLATEGSSNAVPRGRPGEDCSTSRPLPLSEPRTTSPTVEVCEEQRIAESQG